MKINIVFTILTSLLLGAPARAQDDPLDGSGAGVGVGVGVGLGTGVGANIQVVRVPGNVMQGRRTYAALVVSGSETTQAATFSPYGGVAAGISGIPRGARAGVGSSGTTETKEYGTIICLFNPGTNTVTFTTPLAGVVSVPPRGTQRLYFGNPNWLNPPPPPAPLPPPPPPPSLPFSVDFLLIETATPLEVVALYRYRDERIDSSMAAMVEKSILPLTP
jgi:hypothetical protein